MTTNKPSFFHYLIRLIPHVNTYVWKILIQMRRASKMKAKDIPCLGVLIKKCSCCCEVEEVDLEGNQEYKWIWPTWDSCRSVSKDDWKYFLYTFIIFALLFMYTYWLVCTLL